MKKLLILILILFFPFCSGCNEIIKFNVTFVLDEEFVIEFENSINITMDIVETITDESIEGIYYDSNFNNSYKGETLTNNTILYLKVKEEVEEPFIYEGISKEVYDEIRKAYEYTAYNEMYESLVYDEVKFTNYWGVYSDAIVASYYSRYIISTMYDSYSFDIIVKEEIEDIEIYHKNTNVVRVYKEGKFYLLKEAYEKNILSYDDIKNIAKKINSQVDKTKYKEVYLIEEIIKLEDMYFFSYVHNDAGKIRSTRDKDIISYIYNVFLKGKQFQLVTKVRFDDIYHLTLMPENASNPYLFKLWESKYGGVYMRIENMYFELVDGQEIDEEGLKDYVISRCE